MSTTNDSPLCDICGGYWYPEFHRRCIEVQKQRALLEKYQQVPMGIPDEWHQVHELKIWTADLEAIMEGRKKFELRYNDRDFKEGEFLWLREEDPDSNVILTRSILCEISHTSEGILRGLNPDYILLSLGQWREQVGIPDHLKVIS